MSRNPSPLQPGKLPAAFLADLLASHVTVDDPSVLVAPAPGFDAAVVRPRHDIIVKSDPITFTTSKPAAYLVAVNANDIACLGGVPRWLTVTALFPEGTTAVDVAEIFDTLADACQRIGISLIGGHTEVTSAVRQLVLSGTMVGVPGPQGTLAPGGARPGDEVWITQAAGIEGTSIMATEVPAQHLRGISDWALEVGRSLIDDPGISIVEAAQTARSAGPVTAMHDPTEGGVATALHELADASRLGIEVNIEAVPVWPVTRALADHFGISPLGLISSGALLFTAPPGSGEAFQAAFETTGIPVSRIGTMLADPNVRVARAAGSATELPRYDTDEITSVFARIEAH
ncbi:MAG TPA: AIR synthase family protein [Thermomicrobiales bacterium]|nr:AIR synthase family protein [Thermomicrobiales bacterium]